MTGPDKITELHNRMIELTKACRLEWDRALDGYQWSSPNHSLIVEAGMFSIYDNFGRKLFEGAHPLASGLFVVAASSHDQRTAKLIEALTADLDAMEDGPVTPEQHAAVVREDKGYSEETCVRCGWRMGSPPLNCQNDDTPHVFPSQIALAERADTLERERDEARRNADGMARAPYGEFEAMREARDEARAEADRLREAVFYHVTRDGELTAFESQEHRCEGKCPDEDDMTFRDPLCLACLAMDFAALAGPQTKEQT
jgi:hypothetical protein